MKNERYIEQAVARLREQQHLPERALALSDDDLVAITQSVYNVTQEIAKEEGVTVPIDFDIETLALVSRAAHIRDITLNEFVEAAVENAAAVIQAREAEQEGDPAKNFLVWFNDGTDPIPHRGVWYNDSNPEFASFHTSPTRDPATEIASFDASTVEMIQETE